MQSPESCMQIKDLLSPATSHSTLSEKVGSAPQFQHTILEPSWDRTLPKTSARISANKQYLDAFEIRLPENAPFFNTF
jgi:hypothetical protein